MFAPPEQKWRRLLVLALAIGWGYGPGPGGVAAAEAGIQAPALKGDGVYSLLRRHGLDPEVFFQDFLRLNRGQLGKGNILIEGHVYTIPRKAGSVVEPLFGKGREVVKPRGNLLAGAAFYLVSGHGGPDPGGMGELAGHRLCEDEYAYDVMLRLGRRLMEEGAKVYFVVQDRNDGIRDGRYLAPDSDEVSYEGRKIPTSQVERLQQRVDTVNRLYRKDPGVAYKRCIVIHVDARRKAEDIDIFFYYQAGNSQGKQLASTLRNTIREKYRASQPGRGYEGSVSTRGLYVLNHVDAPVVFLELGNIHHARDQERLLEADNRQAVANWLCDGVLADVQKSR